MPKIELAKMKGARHTVKVPLKFEENGKTNTEQFSVVYRGVSLTEAVVLQEELEASEDKRETMIKQLTETVLELPDVVDQGVPVQPTAEFFETLDTYFLFRINQAITDDRQGNA